MSTIFALARLAEVRDDDTGSHVARVQAFCKMLAEGMRDMKPRKARLSDAFIEHLYQASALHDIGKVGIPDAILLKPGKLTPEEFEVMKKHCEIGAGTLNAVLQQHPDNQFLRMGVEVARSHHEKWDGKGYPDGLQGEAIPLAARITALADVYDALTSKRCYHPPASHEDAGRIILEGDGSHFDPDVVAAFKALAEQFQRVRRGMQN
jgi:putative two-component system response regulator